MVQLSQVAGQLVGGMMFFAKVVIEMFDDADNLL